MRKSLVFSKYALIFTLLLFAGALFLTPVAVQPALAASTSLEITGDGVAAPLTLTLAQLEGMEQYQTVYSAINTWPTKKWYVGKGVTISDLLARAELQETATLIRFSAQDGYTVTFTVDELLQTPRYYYPNFMTNGGSDGSIPGSAAGAKQVEAIVALVSAEGSDNPQYMNDVNSLLLMVGQRTVSDQTGNLFVKYINKIEVLTEQPEKWDAPQANPAGGAVKAGAMITLSNLNNDDDKIHYTLDGSEPTIDSPVYNWIAKRWWTARAEDLGKINVPIGPLNETTTIKAITIGAGKLDSEVATFVFQVDGEQGSANEPAEPTGVTEPATASGKVIILRIGQTEATIDGQPYVLEVAPYIQPEAQRTLAPLRFVSEALGATVDWQEESGQISLTLGTQEIILTPGSTDVLLNGEYTTIDCAPEIQPPGRTFVPLRFISEAFNAQVDYDPASYTVTITQ